MKRFPQQNFLFSKKILESRKRLKSTPTPITLLEGNPSLLERRDEVVGSEGLHHAWNRQWKICLRISDFNISG